MIIKRYNIHCLTLLVASVLSGNVMYCPISSLSFLSKFYEQIVLAG